MLDWLADKHNDPALSQAANRIEQAAEQVLARREAVPHNLGGSAGCTGVTDAICRVLA